MNNRLVLISGKTTTGKSACLRNMTDPEGVLYLNAESGKDLPFPAKFRQSTITDPIEVPPLFDLAEDQGDKCHTVIIDSITYLMDQFESLHVLNADNTMKGWSNYAQYFKSLMQQTVARSTKNVIMTAHTLTTLNEADGFMETAVPIKGALKNQGIESYFSTVISTKRMPVDVLKKYSSPLLNITEEDEILGFKYVFQTKLTKDTVNERIRSPMGMWSQQETFIDNDVQLVIDRLNEYYA